MQCPKCSYEPTMAEMQRSADQCPSCGVYYAKVIPAASKADPPSAVAVDKVRFTDWLDANPAARLFGVLAIGLVIGYFAGREHMKYEIKSAFMDAAASIGSAFTGANPLAGLQGATPEKPKAAAEKPSPIRVRLAGKDFVTRGYQDFMTMSLQFVNDTGRAVRAFDGEVVFTDLLDNEIMTSNVSISDPIDPGATLSWDGEIKHNEFISRHENFRHAELQNMKAKFRLKKVLYQDGTLEQM